MCFGKKKKIEAQKRREAEQRAYRAERELVALRADMNKMHQRYQESLQDAIDRSTPKEPSASWQHLVNRKPVPIARPSERIQLTPIIQPIPLVPYSTQNQPLNMYSNNEYDDED